MGDYDFWIEVTDSDGDSLEHKGGKPSKGTSKDGRLKENKPVTDSTDDAKPAFPGAAAPFKPKKPKSKN